MPFCPKCKAEFRAGFTTCNSCHVRLIDHEPDGTEVIEELPQPAEAWLRDDPKRKRVQRIVGTLALVFAAAAVALLYTAAGA